MEQCKSGCNCACPENAPESATQKKELKIDFLYLDLKTCERCVTTDNSLSEALEVLSPILKALGYVVAVNSVNITTVEQARQYKFYSSPTIRINGIDIENEVKESDCRDCGDLCGDNVDCRVFTFEGKDYEQPSAAMIIDGILRILYGKQSPNTKPYILPKNLKKFFKGRI